MDLFDFSLKLPITDPTWIFLLVLLIILFAPILLNRLRIPHIIGMILAGLVIGEHGFNILARDSSFELFGKVGLYYIMFLAGLEMNMADFKQNRGKAVMLGLLAFIIPIMIGLVVNMTFLKYSLITSVLLASSRSYNPPYMVLEIRHIHFQTSQKHYIVLKPTLPNSSKLLSRAKILNPCSPITNPANIIPMICGIRNLFNKMGANNMISNTRRNIHVGSVIGSFRLKSNKSMGFKF